MMETSPPGVSVISSGKHGRGPDGKTPPSGRGDNSRQKTEGDGPDDVRYAFASTCTISPDVRRSLLQAKSNQWFQHVEVSPGKVVTYFAVPSESRIDDLSQLQLKEVWSARSAEYIVSEAYFFRYATWLEFPGIGTTPIIEAYTVARLPRNTQPFEDRTVACADGFAGLPRSRLEHVVREAGAVAFVVGDTQGADVLLSNDRTTTPTSGLVVLGLPGLKRVLLTGELPPNQAPMIFEEGMTPGGETEAGAQQSDASLGLDETSGGLDGPFGDVGEDEAQETDAFSDVGEDTVLDAVDYTGGLLLLRDWAFRRALGFVVDNSTLETVSHYQQTCASVSCVCKDLSQLVDPLPSSSMLVSTSSPPPVLFTVAPEWFLVRQGRTSTVLLRTIRTQATEAELEGIDLEALRNIGPPYQQLRNLGAKIANDRKKDLEAWALTGEKVHLFMRTPENPLKTCCSSRCERALARCVRLDFSSATTSLAPGSSQSSSLRIDDVGLERLSLGRNALVRISADGEPSFSELEAAGIDAAEYMMRETCNFRSGGTHAMQNRIAAKTTSQALLQKIVTVTNRREHPPCDFNFSTYTDKRRVADELGKQWTVVDAAALRKANFYSDLIRQVACISHGISTSDLLLSPLIKKVNVTLPTGDIIQGAQLKCFNVDEMHLTCWLERVRVLYGIGNRIMLKKQKIDRLGQALSAWFLRDFIWPPGSKSSLMFALTGSYKKEMSALLRQTLALGKRAR